MSVSVDRVFLQRVENNLMVEIMDFLMSDDATTAYLVREFEQLGGDERRRFFGQPEVAELGLRLSVDLERYYDEFLARKYMQPTEEEIEEQTIQIANLINRARAQNKGQLEIRLLVAKTLRERYSRLEAEVYGAVAERELAKNWDLSLSSPLDPACARQPQTNRKLQIGSWVRK